MSWGAAAGAAGSIIGGIAGPIITNAANRKAATRQHERNKEYWNLQNDYNHPSAQMARLRQAGLNPNLIYGTPSAAAVGNADKISPNSLQKVEPMNIRLGEAASKYVQIKNTEQQTDNLRKQRNVMDADIQLKKASALNQLNNAGNTSYKTKREKDLHSGNLEALEQEIRNRTIKADTAEGVKPHVIAKAEADFRKANSDAELSRLFVEMRDNGIEPGDPPWLRIFSKVGSDPETLGKLQKLIKMYAKSRFVPVNPFKD